MSKETEKISSLRKDIREDIIEAGGTGYSCGETAGANRRRFRGGKKLTWIAVRNIIASTYNNICGWWRDFSKHFAFIKKRREGSKPTRRFLMGSGLKPYCDLLSFHNRAACSIHPQNSCLVNEAVRPLAV